MAAITGDELNELVDGILSILPLFAKKLLRPYQFLLPQGIPPSHGHVLFALREAGTLPVSEIARNLSVSRPNMTPIIDNLIRRGLVQRHTDPADRRLSHISLTAAGLDLIHGLKAELGMNLAEELQQRLGAEDLRALAAAIQTFRSVVEKLPSEGRVKFWISDEN